MRGPGYHKPPSGCLDFPSTVSIYIYEYSDRTSGDGAVCSEETAGSAFASAFEPGFELVRESNENVPDNPVSS